MQFFGIPATSFSFDGRIARMPFLMWFIVTTSVQRHAFSFFKSTVGASYFLSLFLISIVFVAYVFMLTIICKRHQDRNKSGWHSLWLAVIALLIILIDHDAVSQDESIRPYTYVFVRCVFVITVWQTIVLLFFPGTAGVNDYGPPPPGMGETAHGTEGAENALSSSPDRLNLQSRISSSRSSASQRSTSDRDATGGASAQTSRASSPSRSASGTPSFGKRR
jgi:uncharacterized membrane protein YhaH (DUF805 family)